GQHFLKSERALRTIVETGHVGARDTVVEIGPGTGALTKKLLETGAEVIAVEKDYKLFEFLKDTYKKEAGSGRFKLIHGDILEFDLSKLVANSYKLIANIPYNITGSVFKKFLGAKNQPELMVLLVQKEVADRIVGNMPLGGSTSKWKEKESILSISVKAYGVPSYVETVKAGSFAPMPKVDSAIIAIENISKDFFKEINESQFFKLLRAGFKSKRKKLSSNLSELFSKEKIKDVFEELNLDENVRAEDLNIENWQKLAQSLLR
ncbi:MAG: ribosomal RNA small subunit methyltransferase A, partial [Candidatus Zambryskibacteria bacterium]|nr:ribosomal RNA small subunit methyltransferase A [Candidatus Zambryskibacteria bacterium]